MAINFRVLSLFGILVLSLSACTTTFEGNKVDYKSKGKQGNSLEVPPDLSQVNKDPRAAVPKDGSVTASSLQTPAATTDLNTKVGLNALAGMRIERDGTQRWLVTKKSPESLWPELKTFWEENGFILILNQANLGIMETDWAENRAKVPSTGFFGKFIGSLISTNERDKFRTRIERTTDGGSEIYISHKGMAEDFTTTAKETLRWKNRPVDPELEVEFLKRLMIKLGAKDDAAQAALTPTTAATGASTSVAQARSAVVQVNGQSVLVIQDGFDQAWRRLGLSLDRTNFTVEDRDRAKGIYFVRYIEPDAESKQPGFFARMMGSKVIDPLKKYQILAVADGQKTNVRVANTQGQVIQTAESAAMLKILADDLK